MTEVIGYRGHRHLVPDLHYPGEQGPCMRLVAVGSDGVGHHELDQRLREASGLGPDDPIYAFTSHLRPGEFTGKWQDLAQSTLKPDRGVHHMGAYLGDGFTTNAPEVYHRNTLSLAGSPANLHVVSLDGVPQALLNRNLHIVDEVLNDGVVFPTNYWEDDYVTVDLRTTLMFYRDWLLGIPELRHDPRFATYCSEHKLMVLNVALNVPHHRDSFVEIFGPADGPKVWDAFLRHFEKHHGRAFAAADETHFVPLWQRDGITPAKLRPPTLGEWKAWDTAHRAGTPEPLSGFRPLAPFRGMAFRAEREADLIRDFIDTYCRFTDAGGVTAAAALWSFCAPTCARTGIEPARFCALALPIAQKLLAAEARVQAPTRTWLARAVRELREQLPSDLQPKEQLDDFIAQCFEPAAAYLRQGHTAAHTRGEADAWLRKACLRDFVRARSERLLGQGRTVHYAPPAVLHRIEMGQHTVHRGVHFRTVCTAVAAGEVGDDT